MARILIVEDQPNIAFALSHSLTGQLHETLVVGDGLEAIVQFTSRQFDLVLLDVMLPSLDGFDVCKRIRAISNVPVLMLTARDDEIDRVLGLEIGADDYVVKPFSLRELSARVKALLRRARNDSMGPSEAEPKDIGLSAHHVLDLYIDPSARLVRVAGAPVELSRREFDLLLTLVRHPQRLLTREWLMNCVWGRDSIGVDRTVDVHVLRLRDKLGRDSDVSKAIVTLRGVGYRFGSN
jgi:two-component system response regulator RegX3